MVNIKLKLINENFLGLEDIKRIYEEAFPKDEIVPLDIVLLLAKEGLAKIFAICEDNSLIGFISILLGDKLVYGLHLAIDSTLRGKGYGTSMLRTGLDYAFNILGVHTVTIGVFEHNDIAHSCYKKVGFVDKEIVPYERDNIIEMAITKEEFG